MKLYFYIILFLLPFQAFTQQEPQLISEEDQAMDLQTQSNKGTSYRNFTYTRDAKGNVLEKIQTKHTDKYPEVNNQRRDTYTYDAQGNKLSSGMETWNSTTKTWCCKIIHNYTYEGRKMISHIFSKDIKGKIVPEYKEIFKYDASGNSVEKLFQVYDTLLNKYVDGSKFNITYNSKNQILKETIYYWKNGKWIEGYITDFTYNANDSLELKTGKKNYLKALDNLSETITTEGWKIEFVRKWFYNSQGIDIGNTVSIPHPVTGELTIVETREYLEDENRNMVKYAEVIAMFDKENKLIPYSTTRWSLSFSEGGTTIDKTVVYEYHSQGSWGIVSSANIYTLKYDGVVQKGFVDPYNRKSSK